MFNTFEYSCLVCIIFTDECKTLYNDTSKIEHLCAVSNLRLRITAEVYLDKNLLTPKQRTSVWIDWDAPPGKQNHRMHPIYLWNILQIVHNYTKQIIEDKRFHTMSNVNKLKLFTADI